MSGGFHEREIEREEEKEEKRKGLDSMKS